MLESKGIKQCPSCLTMKNFTSDKCVRCKEEIPDWEKTEKEIFKNKIMESFAKGGFLTLDYDEDWSTDYEAIADYLVKRIKETRNQTIGEVENAIKESKYSNFTQENFIKIIRSLKK